MRSLALLLIAWPALALAGWYPVGGVEGSPQDVQVVDAGAVLVTSSGAAVDAGLTLWRVSDGGVVTALGRLHGSFVGGAAWGSGCLAGLSSLGSIVPSPGCGSPSSPMSVSSANFQRFRLLSPAPMFVAVNNAAGIDTLHVGPLQGTAWNQQGFGAASGTAARSLQTAHVGQVDYTVMSSGYARLSLDGGPSFSIDAGAGLAMRDAVPFEREGRVAVAVTSTLGTIHVFPDVTTPTRLNAVQPAGLLARYLSLNGAFGMATTISGEVLSPVPDPNRAGVTWRARDAGPSAPLERISCVDARWCAGLTDAGLVWFYENEARPTVALSVPGLVDAGQVIRLVADAGDGDGDPVFVRWSADGGVFTPVAGIEDGTVVDFVVPGGACTPFIDVTVTDGLATNDQAVRVPLTVVDRGTILLDAGTLAPLAGGPPVSLTAAVQGGCQAPSFSWTTSDGQQGTGAQFIWTPPETECTAAGRAVTVTTTATWPVGLPASTQSTQVLTVQPWGAPQAPAFPSPAVQASGSVVTWLAMGPEHACAADLGFPGTELSWTVDAGGAAWEPVDGGLRVTAPLTCVPLRLTASATREVVGETAGRRSDAGLLVVDITPDLSPLGPGTPFTVTADAGRGLVSGASEVTAACLPQRELSAEVSVSLGPTVLVSGTFASPGGWQLAIPGGCAGGTWDVSARLLEDGGFTGAVAPVVQVSLTPAPARVGELSRQRLDVVCGEGARGEVEVLPVADSCSSAGLSWRAVSGPPLTTSTGAGSTLSLQTETLDFSAVGEAVTLELSSDGGVGNFEVLTRAIELGVQPFVEVSVRSTPPLRREEEPLTLELVLRNPTPCAVDGLRVDLPLAGATPVPNSVQLDGVLVSSRLEGDALVVDEVRIPASGEARLVLRVRPRLLSSPTLTPVVRLAGYTVSIDPAPVVATTGCGCGAAERSSLFALALLLLSRRRRAAR